MLIKIFAAVFAVYEFYKILNAEAYMKIIRQAKTAFDKDEDASKILADSFFRKVLLLEIAYTAYAVFLLFTAYWYFTLILLALSFILFVIDATGRTSSRILGAGSAVSAAVLVSIMLA